jgi:hypothetical protein
MMPMIWQAVEWLERILVVVYRGRTREKKSCSRSKTTRKHQISHVYSVLDYIVSKNVIGARLPP